MKKIFVLLLSLLAMPSFAQEGLKDVLGDKMLIGAAINVRQSNGADARATSILLKHFNAIVAENCMKSEQLQPTEGNFHFETADNLMRFAKENNLTVTGHCLVWHSQVPRWMFQGKDGKEVTRDVLIKRMKKHIKTVVSRYKGKIKGWDVVNEAIEDNGTFRRSPYYRIIGPEFIEIAFKEAHKADPNAELYYNDYSMSNPKKRDAVCRLVRDLKAKGCRIDAVGMQSHNGMDYPSMKDYEASIDSFAACGVKVMMTELDLNVLPNPTRFGGAGVEQNFEYQQKFNPYAAGLPDSVAQKIEDRYMQFFTVYKKHAAQISRITLWGVTDGDSWLNNWPMRGRTNYPLLFDRQYNEKPLVKRIINLFK